ncbi:MAG: Gfo/Idh/MocA family oxidoreductase [Verrucomicrobiota bacterium]|nr:Gfo/Idh/MocA family oxidoreductase [Verrucomicrobiota bacterium]
MSDSTNSTRRNFVKTTTAATTATAVAGFPHIGRAEIGSSNTIKVGLIGCGGRGTGAATQALKSDDKVKLWAMADAFPEKIEGPLKTLGATFGKERVEVAKNRQFTGLNAFEKLAASDVDVVLMATPPGYRPMMLRKCIEAGKHVFAEKPMAIDMAGIHHLMETAKIADEKKLAIQHGYCWRYSPANRVGFAKAHGGEMGRITSFVGTYLGGTVRALAPDATKPEGMSDVEWQLRHWINFEWLSGGPLMEQCIHAVDKMAWAMGDAAPVAAFGNGGRGQRRDAGNVYDNYSVTYEYPGNTFCQIQQRQYNNSFNENVSRIICEDGTVIGPWRVSTKDAKGKTTWKYRAEKGVEQNMYQTCHNEFFANLRAGKIINSCEFMARSTALGILGREAAHTGQRITWDELWATSEDQAPDNPPLDGKMPIPAPPVPGIDKLVKA